MKFHTRYLGTALVLFAVFFRTLEITAYTPNEAPNRTASGLWPEMGVTCAADYIAGMKVPFGTRIEVPGMGEYIVQDRFGAGHNDRVDLFMMSLDDALRWGRRTLNCRVVTPD